MDGDLSVDLCKACLLGQVRRGNTGVWGRMMTELHEPVLVLARISMRPSIMLPAASCRSALERPLLEKARL